jgi:hypothetical protein
MTDYLKRTLLNGVIILLGFLILILFVKQDVLEEELTNCKDKIMFLEKDMQSILQPSVGYDHEEN